jgi:UDP-N-acetylmuramoyl-L-alanyl-D-glutamate--2,6-diaminopimelate ligase
MVDNGCDSVVMEVSSQALKLRRTEGICFAVGVFTNLGRDHIGPGEHADMEEYLQCKRKLFFLCKTAVGNADDACLARIWRGTPCRKVTYGILRQKKVYGSGKTEEVSLDIRRLDYAAWDIVYTDSGSALGVRCRVEGRMAGEMSLGMPGAYNISNGLAAAAVLREVGIPEDRIFPALEMVRVPGRMEAVPVPFDCRILVDYAHNDMSLRQCLKTLKDYHPARLVAVFGCGGNRSRERRAAMGEAAGKYADFTIITTDNPRYERPQDIIKDIEQGIKRTDGSYIIIEDRQEAIGYAVGMREPGDVILIAGKGHETYQEIRGVRYPMDDRELVKRCTQI